MRVTLLSCIERYSDAKHFASEFFWGLVVFPASAFIHSDLLSVNGRKSAIGRRRWTVVSFFSFREYIHIFDMAFEGFFILVLFLFLFFTKRTSRKPESELQPFERNT